jgi:hypothetical protein
MAQAPLPAGQAGRGRSEFDTDSSFLTCFTRQTSWRGSFRTQ